MQEEKTAFLVHHKKDTRAILEEILQTTGFSVLTAETASTALEIYRHKSDSIDLVITDFNLPGMDGREMLRLMKFYNPELDAILLGLHADFNTDHLKEECGVIGVHPLHNNVYDGIGNIRQWIMGVKGIRM